jgi:hypothetical protein
MMHASSWIFENALNPRFRRYNLTHVAKPRHDGTPKHQRAQACTPGEATEHSPGKEPFHGLMQGDGDVLLQVEPWNDHMVSIDYFP